MKDIRVDNDGEFRCWNCGNKGLLAKRTGRAHIIGYLTVGIGALATKKKLKCQTCGEYNDTGTAKPYTGPASRKWRREWEKIEVAKGAAQRTAEARQAQVQADAIAAALVAAASDVRTGSRPELDDPRPSAIEAGSILAPPPPPPPPCWSPDPTGRHEVRYWDGVRWTEHVSDGGVQTIDPTDFVS